MFPRLSPSVLDPQVAWIIFVNASTVFATTDMARPQKGHIYHVKKKDWDAGKTIVMFQ